ncbi:MAG: DNA-directed RNA polymerase subunit omega [Fimbriimonas ginsengisoli]|uniref:DNA-directed RNA polymerase subunit omega n=1 Tax=Fimbriimonas ginsengisoli TaxID=1005039 RepID=A0A931LWF9_FIMGI|nr:DNA-directed RNA polymerase subunit omega [Fimbriimonas ginsengisoli]MBI3721353.1 DNA-directed RNA polymerase subunit omega [Fimbriimonas ginsengisoli]
MLPSPDILNEFEHGRFVLSILAAKRAKQLREGALPLVQVESSHPLTIALSEIAAGKIKAVLPSATQPTLAETPAVPLLIDDTLPAELGMLLPALDEIEVALVATVEEEHEAEAIPEHEEPEVLSISDLVADEETPTPALAEDDTLSLSDIAEQETTLEEEEHEE